MDLGALLTEIEARAGKATGGPWYDDMAISGNGHVVMSEETGFRVAHFPETVNVRASEDDARFVGAARTDVPRLVMALRSLVSHIEAEDDGLVSWPKRALDSAARILRGEAP